MNEKASPWYATALGCRSDQQRHGFPYSIIYNQFVIQLKYQTNLENMWVLTFCLSIPKSVHVCSINMSNSTKLPASQNTLILSLALNFP